MDTTELGRTGQEITRIGMGCMPLSLERRPPRDEARKVLHRAVEVGVTFFDTADSYCIDAADVGHNERLIAEALDEIDARDRVLVATKAGTVRPGGRWERNGHPDHIRNACQRSLEALGVERISLYQLHAPDPDVPFEESVGAFAELKQEGKVAAVGLSNVSLAHLRTAQDIVEIASVQNRYNPWDRRSEESGILDYCREEGITFIPYSPLGGGRRVKLLPESDGLRRVAERVGHTVQEVVLAWLLSKSPSLVPIPGASRTESIESSVRAAGLDLDQEIAAEVEEAFGDLPD